MISDEITNNQETITKQIPRSNNQTEAKSVVPCLVLGIWLLFGYWKLVIGYFITAWDCSAMFATHQHTQYTRSPSPLDF